MELNNDNNDSDWLKEMKIKINKDIDNVTTISKLKIYPTINCGCSNSKIIALNDGKKTQKCVNCGYFVNYN